jgi:hypothetical protein
MNQKPKNDDPKTDERRDAGLTKMLKTPPKQHKDMKKGKAKQGDAANGDGQTRQRKTRGSTK